VDFLRDVEDAQVVSNGKLCHSQSMNRDRAYGYGI
jgi:hypothetical protein